VVPNANAEAISASLQSPEAERGMMRVLPLKKMIVLDGEALNLRWQRLEFELPCGRVGIQFLVPSPLFPHTEPFDDAPIVVLGQAINCGLNLLNSAHAWSLSKGRHP